MAIISEHKCFYKLPPNSHCSFYRRSNGLEKTYEQRRVVGGKDETLVQNYLKCLLKQLNSNKINLRTLKCRTVHLETRNINFRDSETLFWKAVAQEQARDSLWIIISKWALKVML